MKISIYIQNSLYTVQRYRLNKEEEKEEDNTYSLMRKIIVIKNNRSRPL